MFSFWKSIPLIVKIVGITLIVLALIATYQWGFINGSKPK